MIITISQYVELLYFSFPVCGVFASLSLTPLPLCPKFIIIVSPFSMPGAYRRLLAPVNELTWYDRIALELWCKIRIIIICSIIDIIIGMWCVYKNREILRYNDPYIPLAHCDMSKLQNKDSVRSVQGMFLCFYCVN